MPLASQAYQVLALPCFSTYYFFSLVLIRECSAKLCPSFWFANFPTPINKKDSKPMRYPPVNLRNRPFVPT